MHSRSFITLLAAASLMASLQSPAANAEGGAERAATSRAELVARLKSQTSVSVAPAIAQQPRWDLMEHSEFICYNREAVLLPKGAVLHLPDRAAQLVGKDATGHKIVSWLEFVSKYPAVVSRVDITIQNASGEKPLDPKLLETAVKSGRIAVAVLNGSPISVARIEPAR